MTGCLPRIVARWDRFLSKLSHYHPDQKLLTSNPVREKMKIALGQFRGASGTQTSIEAAPNPFSETFCELSHYS